MHLLMFVVELHVNGLPNIAEHCCICIPGRACAERFVDLHAASVGLSQVLWVLLLKKGALPCHSAPPVAKKSLDLGVAWSRGRRVPSFVLLWLFVCSRGLKNTPDNNCDDVHLCVRGFRVRLLMSACSGSGRHAALPLFLLVIYGSAFHQSCGL